MPRYEFKCPSCGRIVEVIGHMDVVSNVICPTATCGAKMEKQPSAPNFSIKGYSAKNGYSDGSQ